jgi:hypothetical protein
MWRDGQATTSLTCPARPIQFRASHDAGIAQLVERNLAKVEVASSSLVSRSRHIIGQGPGESPGPFLSAPGLGGRVVMQRPAKPCTPVRFRP